jgi:hypothetical protein
MRFTAMHARLALTSALLVLVSQAAAGEPEFIDIESRFELLEQKTLGRFPVQPASFMPEEEPGSARLPAPRELADAETSEPASSQCSCRNTDCRDQDCCNQKCSGKGCCEQDCGSQCGCEGESGLIHGVYYTEAQIMWLRAHVMEHAVGKLSEQYQFSPRLVIGYEDAQGIGGRVRYWHYDQSTDNLTDPALPIRFELDLVDIEGTARFGTDRAELVVSGGFRWTDARITLADAPMSADMPGITFAADLRVILCHERSWEWASVAGARYSLLGGDWEGAANGFLDPNHDDNVAINEFYGGFEYIQHHKGYDAFARIAFEVQNWQSDVASQTAGADSINFMGPGVHLGMIL